ncbi:MAG TPA: hypothetical protein VK054_03920 [Beutenbergiaceae bacterium]|nr:hypothetical protein [Beutenbergiaceae bacterium]
MTTTFTASNGVRIKANPSMPWRYMDGYCPGTDLDTAMAEYYQHRRDVELGRWRDPENPYMVCYPFGPKVVRVLDETAGLRWDINRHDEDGYLPTTSDVREAAARYFEQHPEPKPWHNAQDGELWVLTIDGGQEGALAWRTPAHAQFETATGTIDATDTRITHATRVWPGED